MRKFILLTLLLCSVLLSCTKEPEEKKGTTPPPLTTQTINYFKLDKATVIQLTFTEESTYQYKLVTTGVDPHVNTHKLSTTNHPDSVVLTFEYTLSADMADFQIFFAPEVSEARSANVGSIPASSTWKKYSVNLSTYIKKASWGNVGQYMRLDFGKTPGLTLNIRNMYLRAMTDEEKKQLEDEQELIERDARLESSLKKYIETQYTAKLTNIKVNTSTSKVNISGNYGTSTNCSLCEITPDIDLTITDLFSYKTALDQPSFNVELERYVTRDGINYDRALSKWVIVKNGTTKDEMISTARYADDISPVQNMTKVKPSSKKGLGGVSSDQTTRFPNDLTDLGITSVTMNIVLNGNMFVDQKANTIAHAYGGMTYYFGQGWVTGLDTHLKSMLNKNIVVAAILLIAPKCSDKVIENIFKHPSYTPEGTYTMPNMTNPTSVNCYAAALDFLASRYCRADNSNGRIHNWIMHNEVDAGISWTNMGVKPVTLYMDTYIKSMRLCHNIVRQYDQNSEIFASFTHSWSTPNTVKHHASKDMLTILHKFCVQEGDFKWALAYHCYPQDLRDPKTWKDTRALFSMNSPMVSFKNLEVIDKWIRKSENLYKGVTKRSLWLSENGTNSPSYEEQDLEEQAAGCAYAWKKLNALEGIDAIQWHRWVDHRNEGGLRFGLRRFSDDELEPGGEKPVWHLYQAAGEESESTVFDQYLPIIGINDWDIIKPVSEM